MKEIFQVIFWYFYAMLHLWCVIAIITALCCLGIKGLANGLVNTFIVSVIVVNIIRLIVRNNQKETERKKIEEKKRSQLEAWRTLILDINQTGFWSFIYKGIPTKDKKDTNMILAEITNYPIIIDTNIWMDTDLDCFWQDLYTQCCVKKQKVIVPSTVYEEIITLKKNSDQEKSFKARLAQGRIMDFSNADLLLIHDIKKTPNPYAYADIDIINMCEYILNKTNTKMFSLITNDKDLIIRTRHILNEHKINNDTEICRILSVGHTKYTEKWNEYKSLLS